MSSSSTFTPPASAPKLIIHILDDFGGRPVETHELEWKDVFPFMNETRHGWEIQETFLVDWYRSQRPELDIIDERLKLRQLFLPITASVTQEALVERNELAQSIFAVTNLDIIEVPSLKHRRVFDINLSPHNEGSDWKIGDIKWSKKTVSLCVCVQFVNITDMLGLDMKPVPGVFGWIDSRNVKRFCWRNSDKKAALFLRSFKPRPLLASERYMWTVSPIRNVSLHTAHSKFIGVRLFDPAGIPYSNAISFGWRLNDLDNLCAKMAWRRHMKIESEMEIFDPKWRVSKFDSVSISLRVVTRMVDDLYEQEGTSDEKMERAFVVELWRNGRCVRRTRFGKYQRSYRYYSNESFFDPEQKILATFICQLSGGVGLCEVDFESA